MQKALTSRYRFCDGHDLVFRNRVSNFIRRIQRLPRDVLAPYCTGRPDASTSAKPNSRSEPPMIASHVAFRGTVILRRTWPVISSRSNETVALIMHSLVLKPRNSGGAQYPISHLLLKLPTVTCYAGRLFAHGARVRQIHLHRIPVLLTLSLPEPGVDMLPQRYLNSDQSCDGSTVRRLQTQPALARPARSVRILKPIAHGTEIGLTLA